jgi:hypothetical protein
MQAFVAQSWKAILEHNHLDNFTAWWQLKADWFEEPNKRRGGWSGVSRLQLDTPDGNKCTVFLKRQQEHSTRTWRHPFKGILTFAREMQNILAYQQAGVPALEPVYFEQQRVAGKRCAVLVTVGLQGFTELQRPAERSQRKAVIKACAETVKKLHAARLQHNCLYPKHLFVRIDASHAEARLIDLEKTKRVRSRRAAMLRDLDSLNRHANDWSRTDKLRFVLEYSDSDRVNDTVRSLWQTLLTLAERKQRKRT